MQSLRRNQAISKQHSAPIIETTCPDTRRCCCFFCQLCAAQCQVDERDLVNNCQAGACAFQSVSGHTCSAPACPVPRRRSRCYPSYPTPAACCPLGAAAPAQALVRALHWVVRAVQASADPATGCPCRLEERSYPHAAQCCMAICLASQSDHRPPHTCCIPLNRCRRFASLHDRALSTLICVRCEGNVPFALLLAPGAKVGAAEGSGAVGMRNVVRSEKAWSLSLLLVLVGTNHTRQSSHIHQGCSRHWCLPEAAPYCSCINAFQADPGINAQHMRKRLHSA